MDFQSLHGLVGNGRDKPAGRCTLLSSATLLHGEAYSDPSGTEVCGTFQESSHQLLAGDWHSLWLAHRLEAALQKLIINTLTVSKGFEN